MRITIQRKRNGEYTTQVNIQDSSGSIYRSSPLSSPDTNLSDVVVAAIAKVDGRDQNLQERAEELAEE